MLTSRQLFERYDPDTDDAAALLRQIVEESHLVIKLTAVSAEQEPHSTIAAFLINPGGDSHWVHAGDSRIYHFSSGRLSKRTLDHSYVQALIERGEITEEEAQTESDQAAEGMGQPPADEEKPAEEDPAKALEDALKPKN